ncbi:MULTISPECIES: hypothetical protein [Streptomyces]|uniref:Uncharacterized protein n=2 Tax=Streptomyces rimosus subsp. rimosus TaxID=132474 RepID=L8EYV4_STRR1|nr:MULTISPECIES: hypothetical protein [Streptomyces]KOG70547.1 hypothetical protein ADK78_28580 [Kitasatospora aureofaciens]MYT47327.1 hypothetical protein [Streptomyces sp. SID5471]KEF04657.1 hypothetical protein DF17_22480 [Streptomyces rimosus]KEF19924.1 hypothetical protein DF18_13890 [Streptomyces rimosus]KOT31373.1 hypothetical protein ADK84_30095 [Streptomyces sp. NRRL WC-3701]
MSSEPWTIDSIAHALPHPELRATFMRDVSFTDVQRLPDILERWVRFIAEFEEGRPRIEKLRSHYRETGRLPADYEASLIEVSPEELRACADRARGAA